MNRVRVWTFVLAFTLICWSTPVSAVTITFTEIVSFINFTEIPRDVSVGVDVPACPAPETVAAAPPCVRRTLTNPEFGFVELSVPPGTFPDARESSPARALLLEADGKTISDQVTLFVVPAVPTGAPRDTVNIQFDSDPIEGSLGAPANGLLFSATETTGAEVDLTSKFFTGTGTNRTDQYTLPQGFSIKATSDVDASVSEPMTLTLVASGVAALGAATWKRHRRSAPARPCDTAGVGFSYETGATRSLRSRVRAARRAEAPAVARADQPRRNAA